MARVEEHIRAAVPGDLAALVQIYNHYVVETAITFDTEPVVLETRRRWMQTFESSGPHRLLAAVQGGQAVGYAYSHAYRRKAAYATTVETSIYLAPRVVSKGLGTRLYTALFDAIAGEDLHRAVAGVTLPNAASLALHRRLGFEPCGVQTEVGRKFGRYWDVQWLERAIGS